MVYKKIFKIKNKNNNIFSSNRPTGRIPSSSCNVRLFVCLLMSMSPFHILDFEAYFAPTSQSRMSKFFRDSESLGKSARKNIFVVKWSKIAVQKKVSFLLILPYTIWWKPRFLMDQRPLVEGCIANFCISLDVFELFCFGLFFPFIFFVLFLCILGPPYCDISDTIRIGQEIRCLPYAEFF